MERQLWYTITENAYYIFTEHTDYPHLKDEELKYRGFKSHFKTDDNEIIDIYIEDYSLMPFDKREKYYQSEQYFVPMGRFHGRGFLSKTKAMAFSMAMSIYVIANCHLEYSEQCKPIYLKNAIENAVKYKDKLSSKEYQTLIDGLFAYHESDLDAWSCQRK